MALRPLYPKPPQEPIGDGWDLVASEAGRSDAGLRATIFVLNGEPKDTKRLTFGDARNKQTFADEVAALSGIDAAVILQALPKLAYAIEALLRTMDAARTERQRDQAGQAFTFPEVEPWPEEVDGDALLEELAQVYRRYLVLPDGGSQVLALWTLHTYVFHAFGVSPYLTLTSPQKRCGKSTVLMVASALTHAPLLVSNASPAALFRTIEVAHPTLLVDEAETSVRDNDELRGIRNSGHTKRTAFVLRTVGEDHAPRMFSTWTPKMLAGIGTLPDTIRDRSIMLPMARKKRSERVEKWREREVSQYLDVRRRCVRWAMDTMQALATADPPVPDLASDRAADNWATLLAIADQAGGEWRQRTEEAISALRGGREDDEEENAGLMLLADLRRVFTEQHLDRMASESLVQWLATVEERPWAAYGRQGKPITKRQVFGLLKPFQIRSTKIRLNAVATAQGYLLADCLDSFSRYLPPDPGFRYGTTEQTSNDAPKDDFRYGTEGGDVPYEKAGFSASDKACSTVPYRPPPRRGGGRKFFV